MKSKTNRVLALLLTLITAVGLFPTAAFALEQNEPNTVTEKYINEADGREIAAAQTSRTTEIKDPQVIVGYEYESFSEVTEYIYAKEDLTYIIGYPDKTVQGERNLSRSEAAAIFYRLYDGYYPQLQRQMKSATFSDIPRNAWYYTEVELCYNVGLINGYNDGTFRPNDPISRAEFAVLAARFAELTNSGKAMFNDVTKDHWAYQLINAAAEAGWIQGYGNGTYRPESFISRAETVTLINRMRNRSITVDELKALGVKNPYTDLVETYWAYTDLMEATVKHAAADWHDLTYNDGNLNIIVEKYVDVDDNEIAESTVSQGKENHAYRQFDKHYYLGYITEITYVYTNGATQMSGTKTVDKSTAPVGDTLTYTITVSNGDNATASLENVVVNDAIPEHLTFVYGSVLVDGATAKYSYNNTKKLLTVELGDIAAGQSKTITFAAVIKDTAYGKEFKNVAILSADNSEDKTVTDTGVTVDDGAARMTATKSVDKATAKVGDTLIYTVTATNAKSATASLENVVVNDVILDCLTFVYGSVQVDGATAKYSYNSSSKLLTVELGEIAAGQTKTITFAAVIKDTAYGKEFKNVAILSADNSEDKTVTDKGVTVDDGAARMTATKSVDKATAKVGDTLTYSITATNAESATVSLENVVMNDTISSYLTFSHGSVQVDGATAKYSYNSTSRLLTVELGDIAAGQTKTITFEAVVNSTAYGKSFNNVAVLSADNDSDKPAIDDGTTIEDGTAHMSATKSADKSTVKVSDTLTYTITATNSDAATVNLKNVVMTDTISDHLTFSYGSVQVDGYSAKYSYNNETKLLTVELGDIAAGQTKTITFSAVVNSTAYGKSFKNTAVLTADNDDDKTVTDKGVNVEDGAAEGSVGAKTVSSSTAKVGDTLTYTITLRNASTATAPWTGVEISDIIPEYLSFISGSVEENGRSSTNFAYNANTKTLKLFADSIGIGESTVFKFKVTVQDGAQAMYIVNTAVVSSDDREDIELPDTGVQIDSGNTIMSP